MLEGYAPPRMIEASALEASLGGQSLRSWTASIVQASVVLIHFGIGGVMELEALDGTRIHNAVLTVQQHLARFRGRVHRLAVDDKGCVMKVVFGADQVIAD